MKKLTKVLLTIFAICTVACVVTACGGGKNSAKITSDYFDLEGNTFTVMVPSDQETFYFGDKFNFPKECSVKLFRNIDGTEEIPTFMANLEVGENTFYLTVTPQTGIPKTYRVVVNRNPGLQFTKSGKTYSVTAYTGSIASVSIPTKYMGYPVTSIGDSAFASCDFLTEITIPREVTSIGSVAFLWCDSLTTVNYLGTIDQWAQISFVNEFANPMYEAEVFKINGEEVTEITLTTTKISNYAFLGFDNVTKVTIPQNVTKIGEYAFEDCDSLIYTEQGNCNYLGNNTNPYLYLAGTTSDKITEATISSNCKFIASEAFSKCDSLTEVVIPSSVTNIGDGAFWKCESLTNIKVDKNNANYKDINGNLYSKKGSTLLQYAIGKTATTFTVPEGVTSIGNSAFYDCESLTKIVIPDSVNKVGFRVFAACDSLTTVTFGKDSQLTNIGSCAFENCRSLTEIVIPDSVTIIGSYAFQYCYSLTGITFSDTSTWFRTTDPDLWDEKTGGTETAVSTPAINAEYFKSTYSEFLWYKK